LVSVSDFVMPVLSLAGDIESTHYQQVRLIAQDLSKQDSSLQLELHPLLQSDWFPYLKKKEKELKLTVTEGESFLLVHSVDGHISNIQKFFAWALQVYKYVDIREDTYYSSLAKDEFIKFLSQRQAEYCFF